MIEDEYNENRLTRFWLCLSCYNDALASGKIKEVRAMAGKIPSHDLVVGKRNVGALWDSESKKGLKYHSGYLDVSAIKELVSDESVTKSRTVKNKDGSTREIKAMRVAMFKRTPREKKASGDSW